MEKLLEKIFVIEGILFCVIGILFIFNPINSLVTLTNITGLMLIAIGILSIIRDKKSIAMSIIDLILGVGLISMPAESVNLIISFYGAWSVVRGIYLLVDAFRNDSDNNKFNMIYASILVILGLIILFNPIIEFIAVPYIIGSYFFLSGAAELFIGFRMK